MEGIIPSQAAQRLMEALPNRLSIAGVKTLRQILQDTLPSLNLSLTPTGRVNGLDDEAWQFLWARLIKAGASYGSRRRYKRLLLQAAQIWQAAGLIEHLPDFTVPPRHRRRSTVSVDRLGGYRFSDYQRLVKFVVDNLSGQKDKLAPPCLSDQLPYWLTFLLLCSGVCQSRATSLLAELIWEDVPLDPEMPLRLPRPERRGYVWLWLPPLTRLLLLALAFRAGQFASQDKVFTWDKKTFRNDFRRWLVKLCESAGAPPLKPSQLVHFVRLDLRQVLPNLHLAVLLGQVPFTPVPPDQVLEVLGHERPPTAKLATGPSTEARPVNEDQSGVDWDEAELLAAYDHLLDGLRSHLGALFQPRPAKQHLAALEKWVQLMPDPKADLSRFNLAWLVRWLLDMVAEKGLASGSCGAYWTAALRVLRAMPDRGVHEIDSIELQELLSAYPGKTAALTRAAWKRLWLFLQRAGLPVVAIPWRQLRVRPVVEPARVLTPLMGDQLLAALHGTELAQAQYLAQQATLRVSEVCRLQANDLVLNSRPYLIIRRSKRGRNRRVSLEHLRVRHLERLGLHQQKRLAVGADALYLVDEKGQPLNPKAISQGMRKALTDAGLRDETFAGLALRFHSGRAASAEAAYRQSGDVRFVSLQMGHLCPATTVGSYLHTLDLQSVPLLKAWSTPLARSSLHLPVVGLAALLGRTSRRAAQMVSDYNQKNPSKIILLKDPNHLPDGSRPAHPGHPADYIDIEAALRLLGWLIQKKHPIQREQ
jgi:integrase